MHRLTAYRAVHVLGHGVDLQKGGVRRAEEIVQLHDDVRCLLRAVLLTIIILTNVHLYYANNNSAMVYALNDFAA